MHKNRLLVFTLILATSFIAIFYVKQANANILEFVDSKEEAQIKQFIETYFEARYHAHTTLLLESVEELIGDSTKADNFRHAEMDKLEIEFYHAKVNQLRYVEYKYFLEFREISFDEANQTAKVSLIEGHDVVFENSAPLISTMRNLRHTIVLQKSNDQWKIVSDDYDDYLWHLIRTTKRPKEEIFYSIDDTQSLSLQNKEYQIEETSCSLPIDTTSFPYNRYGAVAYAHQWATASPPYNSPPYNDFTNAGGDCTNFISQAIHEGGGSPMVFGGIHNVGTVGWYYYNIYDRASAWNWVDNFYSFVVGEIYIWGAGPEGCEFLPGQALVGDIIQYDWDGNGFWDHSAIIVSKSMGGQGYQYYVAGHSPDVDNYPYQTQHYDAIRFVHIERIDGTQIFLPFISKEIDYLESKTENSSQVPYPGPEDNFPTQSVPSLAPYPAP